MISEEEKKALENVKLFLYKDKAFVTADEIDLVFNLIEKQQKEIQELETENMIMRTVDKQYISKDKIRAKIKELENKNQYYIDEKGKHIKTPKDYKISVLKEIIRGVKNE